MAESGKIAKLVVAYTTRTVKGYKPDASRLTPPANYKVKETIDRWFKEAEENMNAEAARQPYTGTFDTLVIADIAHKDVMRWKAEERLPFGDKQAVCLAARGWLLGRYPDAWPDHAFSFRAGLPSAVFIGFDPKLFLRMLGIECSLPANQPIGSDGKPDYERSNALPLGMWHGNTDHRDIEQAVRGLEYRYLSWPDVLAARGLLARFAKWPGPHVDVEADLALTTELAAQIGLLNEEG